MSWKGFEKLVEKIKEFIKIIYRIFWIISLVVSLIFTGLLLGELIEKLMKTPIVVSHDDTSLHVSDIFFPSVTICPGLCSTVHPLTGKTKQIDYAPFVDGIKLGELSLSNFTTREYVSE